MSRILPMVFVHWNAVKGGSDTITKMIWSANYSPPSKLPQANVVARMIMLLMVFVHCLKNIVSAKEDLKEYLSLHHFCKAASFRSPFHKLLLAASRTTVLLGQTGGTCSVARATEDGTDKEGS